MLQLASWIRECDSAHFGMFIDRPGICTLNARIEPVDVATVHGLLITGGPDISEEFLDQPVGDSSLIRDPEPERDAWEFIAVLAAINRALPSSAFAKACRS